MDETIPEIKRASERYWAEMHQDDRGDELVGHVSDIKECNRAVFYRRRSETKEPLSAATKRMFNFGHVIEATEAEAIARGLEAEGWKLERDVLVWAAIEEFFTPANLPADFPPAARFEIEQRDEATGLIGGRLPAWWRSCELCLDIPCRRHPPRTALAPEGMFVGHADYVLTKAWASIVVDCKSKARLNKGDYERPREDYIAQVQSYGFSLGSRYGAVLQVGRDYGEVIDHLYDVREFTAEFARRLRQLSEEHVAGVAPEPAPPMKWSCGYCPYLKCYKNEKRKKIDALDEDD